MYETAGDLPLYGSARDSNPIAALGQHTPPGACWLRVFVAADNIGAAVARLEQIHLTRPIETLEQCEAGDWVAAAIGRHAIAHLAMFQPFVFVVVALVSDGGRHLVYALNDARTDLVEVGQVDFDSDGPRIMPRPGGGTRPDETLPLTVKE